MTKARLRTEKAEQERRFLDRRHVQLVQVARLDEKRRHAVGFAADRRRHRIQAKVARIDCNSRLPGSFGRKMVAQVRRRRTQAERSAETRRVLLETAISTLHEKGYAATTAMLVAERAGVSRGAMLHQFRTKADLMTFVVESVYEEEVERYREMLKDIEDPLERSLAYPDAVWKVLSRPSGTAVLEIMQGSRSDEALARRLRPVQARIEADAREKVHSEIGGDTSLALMRLVVWAVRGLSIAKVLAPDRSRVHDAVYLLRDLMRAGFERGVLAIQEQPQAQPGSRKRTGT
jgi:AcrR family transcriptional regulator